MRKNDATVSDPNAVSRRAVLVGGASMASLVAGWRSSWLFAAAAQRAKTLPPRSSPVPRPSPNPYLSGNFAPVDTELSKMRLPIDGSVPHELRGTLLRNGPNPIAADPAEYHWFLGDGMLHAIELRDGEARYRNRWVRTDVASDLLGEDPIAAQPAEVNPTHGIANTSIVSHAGSILALCEAYLPTAFDTNLKTIGRYDFDGALQSPMTAHPKIDPVTGEMLFFGYDAFGPPYLRFHVADRRGELVRSTDIEIPGPAMMHDFAITEHHVVFFDAPALFDLSGFLRGGPMIRWEPELGTRIGVMRRDGDGSDLRWAEIEPCYVFHFLNAWSDGSTLVLDGCRLPRLDIGLDPDADATTDDRGYLTRFSVDLATDRATTTQLTDLRGDFPRIDDRAAGREHHVGYLATTVDERAADDPGASNPEEGAFDSVTRIDLADGTTRSHRFGRGRTCGEPVFAPDPSRDAQDGGWLLTWVYDAATDLTELVVLDAEDIESAPVATVHTGRRVPFGFHGSWIPD